MHQQEPPQATLPAELDPNHPGIQLSLPPFLGRIFGHTVMSISGLQFVEEELIHTRNTLSLGGLGSHAIGRGGMVID